MTDPTPSAGPETGPEIGREGGRDIGAFGAFLVERGLIDAPGHERAARVAAETGKRLNVILATLGLVSDRHLADGLAEFLGLPRATPDRYPDLPVLENVVSAVFLKEARVLPIAEQEDGLALAMVDPFDAFAIHAMELIAKKSVLPHIAVPEELEAAIDQLYESGPASIGEIVEGVEENDGRGAEEDIERLKDLASEAPVIRLVNLILGRAVEARASDVHIEPSESHLRVRYRIDGVLREAEAPPNRFRAAIISRIKIMAKLNIAERRLPLDGRVKLVVRGKDIDLRVSTIPTMHGESVSIRILDKSSVRLDFASLGFDDDITGRYRKLLARPNGILLVTGPTGSGKSTTLYASLLELNSPGRHLLTVEDPVEYQIEGVNQIQVKPQIGLTFAHILRSILRHDPDVVMIGEIRDKETAQIAVRAALTGHVVLSTLHTNNAASTITRLLEMGVENYLLTSTLNGIIGQRLVRTLCEACRESYPASRQLVSQLKLKPGDGEGDITLWRPKGCERCHDAGYLGRTTILELLPIDDSIRHMIVDRAEAHDIQRAAVEGGMRTMFAHGVEKALAGITTLDEVLRVTSDT
jgi:general secretion pathway protein E